MKPDSLWLHFQRQDYSPPILFLTTHREYAEGTKTWLQLTSCTKLINIPKVTANPKERQCDWTDNFMVHDVCLLSLQIDLCEAATLLSCHVDAEWRQTKGTAMSSTPLWTPSAHGSVERKVCRPSPFSYRTQYPLPHPIMIMQIYLHQ